MSEPPIPPPDNPTPHESEPDEPRSLDCAEDLGSGPTRQRRRSGLRVRRSRHAVQTWPPSTAHGAVWRVLLVAFFGGVLGGVSVDVVTAAVIL